MEESDAIKPLRKAHFVANVEIEGEYTIKQMVVFQDKLYLLIERPDTTPELYYIDDKDKTTKEVRFPGLTPLHQICRGTW